jgi:hypothetical protein
MTRIFIEVDDLEDTVRRIANDPRLPTIDVGAVISSVLDLMFYQPAYDDEQICEFLLQFGIISDRLAPTSSMGLLVVEILGPLIFKLRSAFMSVVNINDMENAYMDIRYERHWQGNVVIRTEARASPRDTDGLPY